MDKFMMMPKGFMGLPFGSLNRRQVEVVRLQPERPQRLIVKRIRLRLEPLRVTTLAKPRGLASGIKIGEER